MKNILIVLLSCALISCQEGTKASASEESTEGVVVNAGISEEYFYKRLEGTIAGQPVVMHLVKNKENISGSYYYRKTGGFISLSGSQHGNTLSLTEYTSDDGSVKIEMNFDGAKVEGTWTSGDGKKVHPVQLEEKYPAGSYQLDYYATEDSVLANPDRKDGPEATTSFSYVLPKDDNKLIKQQVSEMLGVPDSLANLPLKEGVAHLSKSYFAFYGGDMSDREEMGMEPNSAANSYDYSMNMAVRYNENGYLILEDNYYEYSGGAHPNHGTFYRCLDMKNNKQLTLSDIIVVDSATIAPIMEEYFRKGNENITAGQPLSQVLFASYLMPNENFYFNEKGIGFWYNPYEIAAYAYGDSEVFIPFERLKAYLVQDFKERMRL